SDEEINKLYDWGRKVSLEYFEEIYKKLGTKFDYYFFESETGPVGKRIIEENMGVKGKKVFETGENGAVIFSGSSRLLRDKKSGLHTRVFLNAEGLPTYEAKELGVAKMKYERFPYDVSLVVAASEITEYFKVLLAAMREIFPHLAEKTRHIANGILRLPTGKMSSRTGDVITAERLINEVEKRVMEKLRERELDESEKKEITEKVAIGAIKFSILRQATGKDIIFDFDKSISFAGDSGPYLQYTLARAKSVLRKAEEVVSSPEASGEKARGQRGSDFENTELEKLLFERFPEVLVRAAREYEPHHVCTYLLELASAFNSYYAQNQIVGVAETPYRLALTRSTAIVLTNGLTVLGIPILEQM
ncbi:arginine--tRNA ligase, partial [bacterium]|nr:arginine--tRNA ligase [bacterium]